MIHQWKLTECMHFTTSMQASAIGKQLQICNHVKRGLYAVLLGGGGVNASLTVPPSAAKTEPTH